ncbi:MAG TPA: hypothetical protein VLX90_06250 [Steroidobacteraceae bacterium]|nr:hypothetical protein [Steroidobacteraceae bacterium]
MDTKTHSRREGSRTTRNSAAGTLCTLAVLMQLAAPAAAGTRDQAERIYNRLTGTPPSAADLNTMDTMIQQNNAIGAAGIATSRAAFYNVVLKNFVTPWTNRDQTVFAPLNDYTATVIGMVRDDVPFNTALSADILYTINASGLPAPSIAGNDHYATAETNNVDLSTALVKTTQSSVYGTPTDATAGLITTRGAESAFFVAGTNRAMFRFTMINHFCRDMEALQDTTRPTDRIRQDVARSPGGDSRIFLNSCVGCHSGMDPMAQAFAYYNFDATQGAQGTMVYTAGTVQPKYFINSSNFKYGFITPDNSWSNRWRQGQNATLGWDSTLPGSSTGAKSLGQELAQSDAFADCQVQKVFKAVCYRAPGNSADRAQVAQIKADFKAGGYHLKQVFAETAVYCMGQ